MKKSITKKWIKVALFTLLTIIILVGVVFAGKTYFDYIKSQNLKNKTWIEQHVKITSSDINENILEVKKDKDISIYNMLYQDVIDKIISESKENKSIETPLMIYNPYGTNNNSINIYFQTEEKTKLSYTIKVKNYTDFSKTFDEYETNHEHQIFGFVMGKKNTLTLTLTNEDGTEEKYKYELDFTDYKNAKESKLKVTKNSSEEVTDGLFAILGDSSEVQDYIHLYDNDGILRSEIPIIGYRGVNLLFKDDEIYFNVSETKLVKLNSLGHITKKYSTGKYKIHHDYAFDDNKENLLILASDTTKDSCEDAVIKLNLETGEITDSFYLEEVFKDLRESAYYNEAEVAKEVESVGVDWMHINTINYLGNNEVILSSRETSSIIKLSDIFDNPEIEYIIGDESFWENYEEEKYLLKKVGNFTIQGGQHTVTYEPTEEDGVYYLSMFNNNLGISTTVPDFDWSSIGLKYSTPEDNGKSYYYKYKVDENEGTFELVEKFKVPYSAYMSSVQNYNGHIIIDSAQDCSFSERNQDGKIIRSYKVKCESNIYRVFKYNNFN